MAVAPSGGGLQRHNKPSLHPNALAEIQYGSILKADAGTPSEEEDSPKDEFEEDEAQGAIGVSIGHEQSRLTSLKTPAAEKAAAMEDLDGGALFDSALLPPPQDDRTASAPIIKSEQDSSHISEPGQRRARTMGVSGSSIRMPSPWRAGARRDFMRSTDSRSSLGEAFGGRRRSSSSSATSEIFKRMIASLPSMPKSPSLNFSIPNFSLINESSELKASRERASANRQSHLRIVPQTDGSSQSKIGDTVMRPYSALDTAQMQSLDKIAVKDHNVSDPADSIIRTSQQSQRPSLATMPPRLRRSASHDSAMYQRTLSRASSLGDDTRFENVSEQVNSRLKAIKDSLQDSNFKLPSLPSMSNFSFAERFNHDIPTAGDLPSDGRIERSRGTSLSHALGSRKAIGSLNTKSSNPLLGSSSSTLDSQPNAHPFFTQALQNLTGDLVVMGGYRGSILRSAEPPNRQLWVPIKVGLNLRKVDLEVGLNPEDEESMEERIIPGGMLKNIGPVDMGKRLLRKLRHCENTRNGKLRVHEYGYDWRLSPQLLSRKLTEFLGKLKCNRADTPAAERGATVIAHSLGGLITRYTVNQRPDLFAGVVYAGSPNNCVNILGPLRNGDDVLLSSRVLTAQVNFTIRTSFALLPLDGKCFIDKKTREEYRVDFFNPDDWVEYRFSPCIRVPLPPLIAQPPGTLASLISSLAEAMPSISNPLSNRKNSQSGSNLAAMDSSFSSNSHPTTSPHAALSTKIHQVEAANASNGTNKVQPQMNSSSSPPPTSNSIATACTIPYPVAFEYLKRVLAETKAFKLALAHRPELSAANQYPPVAVIYGKTTPTVYGAKVNGRDGIKRSDAYDELAFASGDGVVLAKAAQLPKGYIAAKGGVVSSERGHVTLLSDLEAVGRCLSAVSEARKRGIGMGDVIA